MSNNSVICSSTSIVASPTVISNNDSKYVKICSPIDESRVKQFIKEVQEQVVKAQENISFVTENKDNFGTLQTVKYIKPELRNSYIIGPKANSKNYVFESKFNHLTLSNVKNRNVYLDTAIAGVDILLCQDVNLMVESKSVTYCNVEYCQNVNISGNVQLKVTCCKDVKINKQSLGEGLLINGTVMPV